MQETDFSELLGKTITRINNTTDSIEFFCKNENSIFANVPIVYSMYHSQDCCESVTVDDINGDLNDLIGTPILQAEKRIKKANSRCFIFINFKQNTTRFVKIKLIFFTVHF
jgi:hypothetical protein